MMEKRIDGLTAYDILEHPECPITLPKASSMTQARIDFQSRENQVIDWYKENKHLFPDKNIMNWTKKQIQTYGIFLAILGILIGISATLMVQALLAL